MSLLDGSAPAGLRADALEGKISKKAPDPLQRQESERREEIEDLFDRRDELNFTERLRLSLLDPKVYTNAITHVDRETEQSEEDKAVFRRQLKAHMKQTQRLHSTIQ